MYISFVCVLLSNVFLFTLPHCGSEDCNSIDVTIILRCFNLRKDFVMRIIVSY